MRPLHILLALAALFLSACATTTSEPSPRPTITNTTPANTPIPPTITRSSQRMPLLQIAMLGETNITNVWTLFDEPGAEYWNHATQADYWPSLYRLAPPSLDLQPAAASGQVPPIECDSAICTATVTLQPNLKWTDGSSFSARDVAFTVNTALQFRLGLDWGRAYNPDVLERAEVLDRTKVIFYFKTRPTLADWQYGVLQGPIVNQAYWQPRISDAVSLLPDDTLLPAIWELEAELSRMQADVEKLNLSLNTMAPGSPVYTDTNRQAQNLQDDLNSVYNKLIKARTEYETQLAEARTSLFELPNINEPTLGAWKFASSTEGIYENQVNLGTPFGDPWFINVRYITYPSESAAVDALLNDEVDLILTADGLSAAAVSQLENIPEVLLSRNTTRSARFLAFNHADPLLTDPVLHQALACMIDPQALVEELGGDADPLPGFVVDDLWWDEKASLPCAGLSENAHLTEAIGLLKQEGYSWESEPAQGVHGRVLKTPGGSVLPNFTLLTPQQDPMRNVAAAYIAQQAEILGLTIDVKVTDSDDLFYAVYGSGDYDMALLGWHLSAYPSFLCEWFLADGQNPFAYIGSSLLSACEAWSQTSDLEVARQYAFEVQSILAQDLPLIPLYGSVRYEAYRNVRYPFPEVVDGLTGLYGAPALAQPIP